MRSRDENPRERRYTLLAFIDCVFPRQYESARYSPLTIVRAFNQYTASEAICLAATY